MSIKFAFVPCCLLAAVMASTRRCHADDESKAESRPPASAELTVRGTVLLPDGRPAAGAIIHSYDVFERSKRSTTADRFGKFKLQDPCLSGLSLHATTADARCQAVLLVPEEAVRSHVSQPLTIQLQPAKPHQVVVTAQGRPVEGAHVSLAGKVFGYTSLQAGGTGADGTVTVWFPAGEAMLSVVAWHPRHGVNGIDDKGLAEGGAKTELALRPPGSHLVRALDSEGRPVAGRTISASIGLDEGDWIMAKQIDATRATTDQNGEVRWNWFPAEGLKYVDVHPLDRGWKRDKLDNDYTPDGLTTIHVRRKFSVEGRLILPSGTDAQGILIAGHGFGPHPTGDTPRTRTRSDGSFTLHVPAGHGYVLGVYDLEWTSDIWSGAIFSLEGEPQREIVLHGERATSLAILVTRGSSKVPVDNARVHVNRLGEVRWTDETGKTRNGFGGIGGWLRTDGAGRARTGAGRGKIEFLLIAGDWRETRTVQLASTEPVVVGFHRKWLANQLLTARPTVDGKKYVPSPDVLALAWTDISGVGDTIHKPALTKDGTVEVKFDENEVSLLLVDRRGRLSGFIEAKGGDAEVELPMRPNATYSGKLSDDRDGSPLADREVRLNAGPYAGNSALDVAKPQRTDGLGRFEFDDVPAGAPLQLSIEDEPGRPKYFLFDGARRFEPGERRTGDVARAELKSDTDKPTEPSIVNRIARAAENCRVTGLHTIVALEGDESKRVKLLAGRLLNGGEIAAIYRYLPVAVTAQQLSEEAGELAAMKWPRPESGEIVMVVTADGKQASATVRLAAADLEAAFRQGSEFIEQHAPPTRDGRQRLEEAKVEAANSNRAVWVITGGPRCGPCFLLARWIDQHYQVLEKDIVVLELTAGLDAHANKIGEEIGGVGQGIPFHAMLSPDGKVLASSNGPQGNIGMPAGSIDGVRHFQTMLEAARKNMTPAEVDELLGSLNGRN